MKRVAVDIGGTFTDLVWFDEQSQNLGRVKTLSTPDPALGLLEALDRAQVNNKEISLFLHATTLITNMIIQRSGSLIGFVTTRGFRDLLEIQTGLRPNPYDLQWEKTPPLVPRYLRREIDERVDAEGNVLIAASVTEIEATLEKLVGLGVEGVAVCFLNAYANPIHEQLVANIARKRWPDLHVSLSYEIDPRIREYARMSTTVANAYSMPLFNKYAAGLDRKIKAPHGVKFMQSSGGVMNAAAAAKAPVNLVYSGPVGGVLGGKLVGKSLERDDLITMDMGGTSFDVCVIRGGEADERDEFLVQWGIPVRTHTVDIHSIGAGGGSIIEIDAGGTLTVGPRSAGSDPGPACYGRGGTVPTVTDANVILGLIRAERFAGGDIALQRESAASALADVAEHFRVNLNDAALGAFRIVNANMAQAIREITVFKGVDPRTFTLVAFGGGGPQHAVEVAREIGIRDVIIPVFPSVFSAFGLLSADLLHSAARTVLREVHGMDVTRTENDFEELELSAKEPLLGEGVVEGLVVRRVAYMRYVGQSHELPIELSGPITPEKLYEAFEESHYVRYGTRLADPAEIVDLKVIAVGRVPSVPMPKWTGGSSKAEPKGLTATAFGEALVFERDDLCSGTVVKGRALIEEPDTATYLPEDARAEVDEHGNIRIEIG
jgi:N-methylhydantoinase A